MIETPQNPKGQKLTKELTFPLSSEEIVMKATEASKLETNLDELAVEKKANADDYKKRIEEKTARQKDLLRQIREKTEDREVECTEVKNFESNAVEYWVDGKKIEERPMEAEERQEEMKLVGGPGFTGPEKDQPMHTGAPDNVETIRRTPAEHVDASLAESQLSEPVKGNGQAGSIEAPPPPVQPS